MDPYTLMKQILYSEHPQTIACCGERAARLAQGWAGERPDVRVTVLSPADPNAAFPLEFIHDIALVSETLERLSPDQGRLLLGQLRNAGARRIAVTVDNTSPWRFEHFIGLGFKRLMNSGGQPPQSVYAYDIANYNHKRQWNNADNWANPERWDKSRW